jgi:hypothetical protein
VKFIDDLFHLYRDHLTGDEEDAIAIVIGLLQEQNREELLSLTTQMNEEEVFQMMSLYCIEMLRLKMAEEGIGTSTMEPDHLH